MARYKNPWFLSARNNSPEYYETKSIPVEHADCLIFERLDPQTGIPVFDVVLGSPHPVYGVLLEKDTLCVAQCAGLNGAKRAAEAKEWEQTDWWKKRQVAA